jgi:hypothetical protein
MARYEKKSDSADSKKADASAFALVEFAKRRVQLFHTAQKDAFARVWIKDHRETYRIKSHTFEEWLFGMCHQELGAVPSHSAVKAAQSTLAAHACFASGRSEVHVRLAAGPGGDVYVDLGSDGWEIVKIGSEGWEVIGGSRVDFWRPPGMKALPRPMRGGTIADLRPFLNLANEDQWVLSVAWLVGALRPKGPYPVNILEGPHGSAKSTTTRVFRELLDPNVSTVRAEPASLRDLMITANNSWCLAYDNLSFVQSWQSDALCRLSTGGGFSTRELYTNEGERIFEAMRPVLLNSIDLGIERGDLLDRAIFLSLPPIPDSARETESSFWDRFERTRPYILGSLFDAVACALRCQSQVNTPNLPRMADFAKWICAAEPALGWAEGTFLDAYRRNRAESNAFALEASILSEPIARIASRGGWKGTATELHSLLIAESVHDRCEEARTYPRTPKDLSASLRRLIPNFKQVGTIVEFGRTAGNDSKRVITIRQSSPDINTHTRAQELP